MFVCLNQTVEVLLTSEVLYDKKGHIAYISLNRPESLNAVTRTMVKELAKIWIDFRDDSNLWVAVLSGEGKSYCAGADVKQLEVGKWEFRKSLLFGDDRIGPSNYKVWKPIIAALHRHVFGAGLWLSLECDIRIAAEDALFGVPEARVNIVTLFTPFLSNFIPRSVAEELLFTASPIDARRAYQVGLVNKVVPCDRLLSEATAMAERICENGPLSIWAMKEILSRSSGMDYQGVLALLKEVAEPVFNAEDTVEARQAFIEKRKPQWKLK